MRCSRLRVNWHFGWTCCLYLRSQNKKPELSLPPTSCSFLALLILWPCRWRHVHPKCRLTFSGLHGIISLKSELSITSVRSSLVFIIEQVGSNSSASDSYWGGAWFESLPEHWLCSEKVGCSRNTSILHTKSAWFRPLTTWADLSMVFINPSIQILWKCLRLSHKPVLLHPFQFIVYFSVILPFDAT
jgi:hypothetical protein